MTRPSLSLRIIPRFPARIQGADGIGVVRSGGTVTIRQDWDTIQQEPLPPDPDDYEFLLRQLDGSLIRVAVPDIILPPVTWSTLSGKPSEFPPSPHTHGIPDIIGLQTALDAKVDDTDTINVAHGGTGRTSATAYAVLCGGTTGTGAHQSVAALGTSGDVLTSNGAGALPTFQTPAGLTGAVRYDIAQGLSSGQQSQARSNIVAPPTPQTAAGVGQIVDVLTTAGNGFTLPAGGTWQWAAFGYNGSALTIGAEMKTGIAAGGTTVLTGVAGIRFTGTCWRLA